VLILEFKEGIMVVVTDTVVENKVEDKEAMTEVVEEAESTIAEDMEDTVEVEGTVAEGMEDTMEEVVGEVEHVEEVEGVEEVVVAVEDAEEVVEVEGVEEAASNRLINMQP
jgi:hypothetical protein